MYSALAVANYFLKKSAMSAMKLQKLVYYAHGWHLGFTKKSLIEDDIEAWSYGPVVPSIYHEFKKFGSSSIEELAVDFDGEVIDVNFDVTSTKIMDRVFDQYGQMSPFVLSEMTHQDGTPWHQTEKYFHSVISNRIIEEYFTSLVNKRQNDG